MKRIINLKENKEYKGFLKGDIARSPFVFTGSGFGKSIIPSCFMKELK